MRSRRLGAPTVEAVLGLYLSALHRQVRLGRPVHLYGHPEVLGRMVREVLPELFRARDHLRLPNMRLSDFARWSLERSRAELALLVDDATGQLEVRTSGTSGFGLQARAAQASSITIDGGQAHALRAGTWHAFGHGEE